MSVYVDQLFDAMIYNVTLSPSMVRFDCPRCMNFLDKEHPPVPPKRYDACWMDKAFPEGYTDHLPCCPHCGAALMIAMQGEG